MEVRTIFQWSRCSGIIERNPPNPSVSIFLRDLVHLDTDFFSSIMFELRFTKSLNFQEAVVNPFKSSFSASSSQIVGNKMVSLFFSLPVPIAMRSHFLNHTVRN